MEDEMHKSAYWCTYRWIDELGRELTEVELKRFKKNIHEKKVLIHLIYPASLHYDNEQVKNILYEYGFEIKPFEKYLFLEIARSYNDETLVKFIKEGFRLTLEKVKRLEKMCNKLDIEMDEDLFNYLEKFKRNKVLELKIKNIRARDNPKKQNT